MVPVGDRLAFDRVIFIRHRPPEVAIGAPARGGIADVAFVGGARHGAVAARPVIGVKEDDVGLYPQFAEADDAILEPAKIGGVEARGIPVARPFAGRSEEHTSELQSLMRISYAVFCLKKKK